MAKIEFVDVTKQYSGASSAAVDHVTFTVAEGAMCMLLGTSGSGKTTLMRMVNRLIDPTAGRILINGSPTTGQDPIALRRSIGYVIQQIGLFPHLTIAENIRVVPSILKQSTNASDAHVDELLDLVGLDPKQYRKRYPRQLSGGQQQRVGLARALAADPAVLLMDEPFGALDAINRARMQDELIRIHRETRKTILFVTHDVDEALKLGDQIAVMADGKLLQEGTPNELLIAPANDTVSRLVGADNILRQFEHIPVTQALEPVSAQTSEHINGDAVLLDALLRLLQTGANAVIVEENGKPRGQITLDSIYRELSNKRQQAMPANDTPSAVPAAR